MAPPPPPPPTDVDFQRMHSSSDEEADHHSHSHMGSFNTTSEDETPLTTQPSSRAKSPALSPRSLIQVELGPLQPLSPSPDTSSSVDPLSTPLQTSPAATPGSDTSLTDHIIATPAKKKISHPISFYIFLIVFYIGSKGASQLLASYVSNAQELNAPIYLTTWEYLMWVILGSIHHFTLDDPTPKADANSNASVEVIVVPSHNTSSPLPSSYDDDLHCECACQCKKCQRPYVEEKYPNWRITVSYLCGELIKTVLEVITVVNVELSLALVLLGTAPLFSIIFRGMFERMRPTSTEICIGLVVILGLAMRIPEISSASPGAVICALISAASAAWISSFKSLIFDPPTAPHVLCYMYRFGPVLASVSFILCLASEMSPLKTAFGNTSLSMQSLSYGCLFAMLAAPSSVVSKRLQRLLGSFQRTLLGVMNNIIVSMISIMLVTSGTITPLAIVGSILVFASPFVKFLPIDEFVARIKFSFPHRASHV